MDTKNNRTEKLAKIKEEILDLKESPLYRERIKNKVFPVIGEGNHYAKIIFIGEAPGRNEVASGRPFCGAAGKFLSELLESAGIKREDVYITNIVKDRPPMNRDPLPEEIMAYGPFLDRQIEIIQPKVIATLGRFSMDYIMRKFGLGDKIESISRLHGRAIEIGSDYGDIVIIPFFHPAVAIYDFSKRKILFDDFKILKDLKILR